MSREPQPSLQPAVHQALRAWHQVEGTPKNRLENLFLVRQRWQNHQANGSAAKRLAANEVLLEGLQALTPKDEIGAKILRERYLNSETALKVAFMLNLSEDQVNRRQRKAIETLASVLQTQETTLRQELAAKIESALPPSTYTQLFGIEQAQKKLLAHLTQRDSPWLIALTGLGGIGKTALADYVIRHLIPTFHFDHIHWLRVEAETLSGANLSPVFAFEDILSQLTAHLYPEIEPGLIRKDHIRTTLKETPHLVIIDNLESEAEILYLFDQLRDLSNPTKFLLTSRMRPPAQTGVLTLPLTELPFPDALAFMRHHAELTDLSELVTAPDEALQPIYHATGGNPFAIKMVISLAAILPLPHILADLPRAHLGEIETLYKHIYLKTWNILSPSARTLLQMMPLISETGGTLEHLQAVTTLSEAELLSAIHELAARSLLEMRGNAWDRRYGIHRLTETFLRTEIINMPQIE